MHVLVTGATGGIGRGICEVLARRDPGLQLSVASSQSGEKLDALLHALHDLGVQAHGVTGDVTQPDAARRIVQQAIEAGGDLDALVCVAGASGPGKLADLPVEQWDLTFNLNTRSVFLMAQAAYASLKRTSGSITAIASMSGLHPTRAMAAILRPRRRSSCFAANWRKSGGPRAFAPIPSAQAWSARH